MAEDNARDMKTLRMVRLAHEAMNTLNHEAGPFPPFDKGCFEECETRLKRLAQAIEQTWN
jgi:hypothetical protein